MSVVRTPLPAPPAPTDCFPPADVRANADLFQPGRILLITLEPAAETVYAAIRLAHERGMLVIFDPAPATQAAIPVDIPPMVDIVKPNETEAAQLTGRPGARSN